MSILKITVPYSHFQISAAGDNLIISVQYPYEISAEQTLIELSPTDDEMPEINESLNLSLPVSEIEIVDASTYKLPMPSIYKIKGQRIKDLLSKVRIRNSKNYMPHTFLGSTDTNIKKRTQVYQVNTGKSTINTIGVIYFQYKKGKNNIITDLRSYLQEVPKKIDIMDDGDHYDVFLIYDNKQDIKPQLNRLELEKEREESKGFHDITHIKSLTVYDELPPDVLVFTFELTSPRHTLESAVNSLLGYINSITTDIIKILTTSDKVYIFFNNPKDVARIDRIPSFQLTDGVIVQVDRNAKY